MASSVVSARDLERWAKERAELKQGTVPMPKAATDSFNAMKPDFEALAKFEQKKERIEEKREVRANQLQTDSVINVMGSTAGAGSGCAPAARRLLLAVMSLTFAPRLAGSSTHTVASGQRRLRGKRTWQRSARRI